MARHFADEAERYKKLVELQGDYLSLATQDGELLYVNAAYAGLYAETPETMIDTATCSTSCPSRSAQR